MNVLLIVATILILIILWLLVAPVQIVVDSKVPLLMIRVVSIGSAIVLLREHAALLQIKFLFWSKEIPFNKFGTGGKKAKKKNKRSKKKRSFFSRKRMKWMLRFFRIPGSFSLKKISVNIDSGDYIINAYMFPIFGQLNNHKPEWTWNVNYLGQIQLYLLLQSSLIRMIYVYFK